MENIPPTNDISLSAESNQVQPAAPQPDPATAPTQMVTPHQRTSLFVPLLGVLLLCIVAGGAYYLGTQAPRSTEQPQVPLVMVSPLPTGDATACTEDARVCPDGTSVVRIPPSCEFAECPETSLTGKEAKESYELLIEAHTMGEVRKYNYNFAYPLTWSLDAQASLHSNDNLVQGCKDFTLTSMQGTQVAMRMICSSWSGKKMQIPSDFDVVSNLGQVGNALGTTYIVRYKEPMKNNTFSYAHIMVGTGKDIRSEREVVPEILVMYQPDDWYFIPVTISTTVFSEQELLEVDQLVKSLNLRKE